MKKICVIGCGPAGLTTIKQLLDENHQPICFEKESDLGGVFHHSSKKGGVYDNLYLTISNYLMAFSDDPPTGKCYYWHHSEYKEYLVNYANKFNLQPYIHFNMEVVRVQPLEEGYLVVTRNKVTKVEDSQYFDGVAVCTGSFQVPYIPDIAGLDEFEGEVVHGGSYKNNEPFKGKNVVCVGIGESAADIVREISYTAQNCYLAIRSYPRLIPRVLNNGPNDGFTTRAWYNWKFDPQPTGGFYYLIGIALLFLSEFLNKIFNRKKQPEIDPFNQPSSPPMLDLETPLNQQNRELMNAWTTLSREKGMRFLTKNVSFIPQIIDEKIDVVVATIDSIKGKTLFFSDGTSVEADAIVFCTGFKDDFSFIDGFHLKDNSVRNMFANAFHPDLPNCAFIGWARPTSGGNPACAEMAARYFALLLSGKRTLPNNMQERIEKDKEYYAEFLKGSPHVHTLVLWRPYMDSLAELIGCKISFWKYLFSPSLLLRLFYGSLLPAHYRLEGPHANYKQAKKAIMSLPLSNISSDLNLLISKTVFKRYIKTKINSSVEWKAPEFPPPPKELIEKYSFRKDKTQVPVS